MRFVLTEAQQKKLGRQIRSYRLISGLSVAELGRRLEVNPQYISNWEGGRSLPSVRQYGLACQELGIPKELVFHEVLEMIYANFKRSFYKGA